MVRLLLEHKANLNATDKSGYTPLLNAAERGNMAIVEILTERGADLAARTLEGATAFGLAAGSTNRLLLEWLSAKQPALDAKDQVPVLQHAALYGRLANVRWLLDKGVPVTVTIKSGTILHAAAGGPGSVAEWLQEKRLGVQSRPPPRQNGVGDEAGSEDDYAQIVLLLLKSGAEVNAVDSIGRTPLHFAVDYGCL
ncbi:MAG: ankyrin repeat domain-containing protein, partial [Verrucomicrobia bacterium]|nr:ankyrin repeat domain-containing protein [Verrucomicrobiota bacterium]